MISPATDITTKAVLRAEAMARRDTITTADRERRSRQIAERAKGIVATARPRVLAAYLPIWSEVDPRPIIAWAHEQRIDIVLPAVIDATTFVFRRYRPGDPLEAGRFGTLAPPATAREVDPDLVISPMIAFDRRGTRLGHGRGFYDRAIAKLHAKGLKPLLVGVAFTAQEVASIPREEHDVHMDWIVTEGETLEFRR